MTEKKFIEEQYKTITDCFDRLNEKYNMGLLNNSLILEMQDSLFDDVYFIGDWPEIVAIANPATREWAHDKFVEKEKKYFWKTKKTDDMGEHVYIELSRGLIALSAYSDEVVAEYDSFTKSEIIEAGYNPDMFDKEEVE
ncbi:hypothetical protein [Fructobacillus fructosus]|uniref:hypothetical protein n=1 Tax=Fructobacillus fructosus TaxID=1631 RepID=UPI002DA97849|nr:hypothetical protein LMG30235_GOPAMIKF_01434 [Fructobacillus fructosus]CAK1252675.1 hypothetical protein R54866_LGPIEIPA_01504 [Fructobacillus fructosus]CAK1252860.1 hypothetical protein LMG30234_GAICNKDF_01517 [Fructobacillus fructosus]